MYRVVYVNQGKIYELYVRKVSQSGLYGFVEIEGFVFGEKSSVLIDPTEQHLQAEFAGVTRSYIPMHTVIRIDEVEKRGTAKVTSSDAETSKIMPFPVYTGPREPKHD